MMGSATLTAWLFTARVSTRECQIRTGGREAARNRRGDALLHLLGRAEEAIAEFDQAQAFAPNDAYILYNRGRAHLALGKTAEAKADFTTAASARFDQPKAKKLALQALASLELWGGRSPCPPSNSGAEGRDGRPADFYRRGRRERRGGDL